MIPFILTVIILSIIFLTVKTKQLMTKQEQIDAQNERLQKAVTGLTADLRQYQEEVKSGSVSQESIDAMDAKITALEALDAETTQTETSNEEA